MSYGFPVTFGGLAIWGCDSTAPRFAFFVLIMGLTKNEEPM